MTNERLVIVTGAARRIGRRIALGLAQARWNVVIHHNTSKTEAEKLAQEIRALGRKAYLSQADFEKKEEIDQLIPRLPTTPTALVHNASLFLRDIDDPNGARHWAVNVSAPLTLNDALYARLPECVNGTIVQILDDTPLPPFMSSYGKSREAMAAMIPELACRYAPRMRINGIALGPTLKNERQSQAHFDALVSTSAHRKATDIGTILLHVATMLEDKGTNGIVRTI